MLRLFILVISLFLFVHSHAVSYIADPVDLRRDEPLADCILVGKITGTDYRPRGESQTGDVIVSFCVDRTLKGKVEQGSTIEVPYRHTLVNPPQMLTGYDLVLLNEENGHYTFARKALSSLPASAVPYEYHQSDDVLANLRREMVHSLQDPDYLVVRAALRQMSILPEDAMKTYVKPRANDPDIRIKALALSACIGKGDKTLYSQAFDLVQGELAKPEPCGLGVTQLKVDLERVQAPEESFSLITSASRSKLPLVREFAAEILGASGNKAALPYLKPLLDDENVLVRYHSVMGLAQITRDFSHVPALERFKAEERQHIEYWKSKDFAE